MLPHRPSLLASSIIALVLAAGCGDDAGVGAGGGGGEGSTDADTSASGTPTSSSTDGAGAGDAACPAFQPGGDMLGVDWALGADEGRFAAFAQAVGDVRVASRVFLAGVARACFDLDTALGGAAADPGDAPSRETATTICDGARATYLAWRGARTVTIDLIPSTCTAAAVDSDCLSICQGDTLCVGHCGASAQAAQQCTVPSVDVAVDVDGDPAELAALGRAFEGIVNARSRTDLLIDAATAISETPAVVPAACTSTLITAVTEAIDEIEAGASLDVDVLEELAG